MRKYVVFLMCCVMVLSLFSCTDQYAAETTSEALSEGEVESLPEQKTIPLEKALQIASDYWYECYHIRPGDIDEQTGFRYALLPKNSDDEYYQIALAWLVEGDHFSTIEMIQINSITGEIRTPPYETENAK